MADDRLVSRLELSRRLTGIKKSRLYEHCKPGGKLYAAMVGQSVNLNHKNARIFCAEFGYEEPDMVAVRKEAAAKARNTARQAPQYDAEPAHHDVLEPDEASETLDAAEYMELPLRELVKQYGRQGKFKELVAAYKVLVSTQALEEKMARDRKEFAHFAHIERLAMHIDGLHKMLLTDAAKNIADTAKTLSAAGATDIEVRKAVTKVLEQVISMAKSQSDKIIRNAKS